MKRLWVAASLLLYHSLGFGGEQLLSDEQVRHWLISESIRAFPSDCPCPYSPGKEELVILRKKVQDTSLWSSSSHYGFKIPSSYQGDDSGSLSENREPAANPIKAII